MRNLIYIECFGVVRRVDRIRDVTREDQKDPKDPGKKVLRVKLLPEPNAASELAAYEIMTESEYKARVAAMLQHEEPEK